MEFLNKLSKFLDDIKFFKNANKHENNNGNINKLNYENDKLNINNKNNYFTEEIKVFFENLLKDKYTKILDSNENMNPNYFRKKKILQKRKIENVISIY